MKCHYVTEPDGKRYLIPGCMPGWHSDSACICRIGHSSRLDDPKDRLIGELERENARLNRMLHNLLNSRKASSSTENMGFYNFPGIGTVHINEGPVRRVVPQHEKHKWNREPKRGQTAVCVKCGTAKCYRLNYDVVYRRAGETEILTERPACTGQPQPKPSTTLSLDL